MDIFSMLQNATIFDADDEVIGQTVGFEVINGRMRLRAIMFDNEFFEDGPDDGDKEEIPEDPPQEANADGDEVRGNVMKLVAGGEI